MKKIALLLCIILLLPCVAFAGGLPDIGGTLPNLNPTPTGDPGVLPDPAELLGGEGTVFAEDYTFSADMICTVYLYQMPGDVSAFLTEYQRLAETNGFAVSDTQVQGFDALSLTYDGKKALLLPEYSGSAMLMVENGMVFGEPLPQGCYIQFTRNGRKITSTSDPDCKKDSYSFGSWPRMIKIDYYFEEEPITLFTVGFPASAQTGDEFRATKSKQTTGMYFYTAEEGLLYYLEDDLDSSADYFVVKITKMEKTADTMFIEGTFEASFRKGALLYEDGSFRVECDR